MLFALFFFLGVKGGFASILVLFQCYPPGTKEHNNLSNKTNRNKRALECCIILFEHLHIEAVFYHSIELCTCVQANSFILSRQPTQCSYVMHIKSLVDWSLCEEAKLDPPLQKGEFCWCRVKLQACDAQPANKPIVKYFFRMAITGNTNGFNYQTWHLVKKEKWQFLTRCTHRQSERETRESEREQMTDLCFLSDRPMCCFICCKPW